MRLLSFLLIMAISTNSYADNETAETLAIRRIALSFDDAPRGDGAMFNGEERATALIDALASVNTGPVVFFVKTGNFQMPGGRERIERYAEAGHLIANHTHSHLWLSQTGTEEYIDDIDKAETLLNGFSNRRAWLRFPFLDEGRPLDQRDAVRAALMERGLMNGYVTVDNYDWYIDAQLKQAVREDRAVDMEALRDAYVDMLSGAVQFYDDIANKAMGRSPAHVLLLHENDMAALFIDDLVAALRKDGWTIISPDEAYKDPINNIVPKTLKTNQGHVAALAIDGGLDSRTLTHLAIEESQIDAMLLERAVFGEKQ